jgi:PRTRC genetic system protein C
MSVLNTPSVELRAIKQFRHQKEPSMALKTVALPRTFYSSGRKLADPNPALSIEEVRTHYAGIYPELNNASFEEEITGTEHKVTFSGSVGHKG